MDKINAVITGVGGYVPEDVLTNEDISRMVDTTDEWIMTRVGIKERRILKGEGVGLSYMGIRAVKQLLEKTNLNPEEVEVILTATTTPDHHFPTTSSIIAYHTGCKNAMTFDMQGACAGFLYALETGANYIRSGRYKKVVVVSGDKRQLLQIIKIVLLVLCSGMLAERSCWSQLPRSLVSWIQFYGQTA